MPRDRDLRPARGASQQAAPEPQRPLLATAVWTGLGAAVVGLILAILAVAICWLPVSGEATGNHGNSTVRAGVLTFLAALHGGVTVAGDHTAWLPLGMLGAVGLICWRAGAALAEAAHAHDETDPATLARAGAAQVAAFAAAALAMVPFATLGTSSASFAGPGLAAVLVAALFAGGSFVRRTELRGWIADRAPASAGPVVRAAGAALTIYLAAGLAMVVASLVAHHDRLSQLWGQVGSGWGGVPILLLSLLAAPNAAIAGTSYLAGPGFALGSGTHVHLLGAAHGTLPAFPLLAAVPTGDGASALGVVPAVATGLLAGIAVAAYAARAGDWATRLGHALGAGLLSAAVLAVLGWQAGGGIGDGRLRVVGPSPWQLGAFALLALVVVSFAALGLLAAVRWIREPVDDDDEVGFLLSPRRLRAVADADEDEDVRKPVKLTKRAG